MEDIVGRYYVINQEMGIDSDIAEPFILYLNDDGTVTDLGEFAS